MHLSNRPRLHPIENDLTIDTCSFVSLFMSHRSVKLPRKVYTLPRAIAWSPNLSDVQRYEHNNNGDQHEQTQRFSISEPFLMPFIIALSSSEEILTKSENDKHRD